MQLQRLVSVNYTSMEKRPAFARRCIGDHIKISLNCLLQLCLVEDPSYFAQMSVWITGAGHLNSSERGMYHLIVTKIDRNVNHGTVAVSIEEQITSLPAAV